MSVLQLRYLFRFGCEAHYEYCTAAVLKEKLCRHEESFLRGVEAVGLLGRLMNIQLREDRVRSSPPPLAL
jgi:hypothetical protein